MSGPEKAPRYPWQDYLDARREAMFSLAEMTAHYPTPSAKARARRALDALARATPKL